MLKKIISICISIIFILGLFIHLQYTDAEDVSIHTSDAIENENEIDNNIKEDFSFIEDEQIYDFNENNIYLEDTTGGLFESSEKLNEYIEETSNEEVRVVDWDLENSNNSDLLIKDYESTNEEESLNSITSNINSSEEKLEIVPFSDTISSQSSVRLLKSASALKSTRASAYIYLYNGLWFRLGNASGQPVFCGTPPRCNPPRNMNITKVQPSNANLQKTLVALYYGYGGPKSKLGATVKANASGDVPRQYITHWALSNFTWSDIYRYTYYAQGGYTVKTFTEWIKKKKKINDTIAFTWKNSSGSYVNNDGVVRTRVIVASGGNEALATLTVPNNTTLVMSKKKYAAGKKVTITSGDSFYLIRNKGAKITSSTIKGSRKDYYINRYTAKYGQTLYSLGITTSNMKNLVVHWPEPADITLVKKGNNNKLLSGSKFSLVNVKNSAPAYSKTKTTNSNGEINFYDLWDGKYTLKEKTNPTGYFYTTNTWKLTVSGGKLVDASPDTSIAISSKKITITNYELGKVNVKKVDFNTNANLNNASFKLTKSGYAQTKKTVNGILEFTGLTAGTYKLEEISAAPDYENEKIIASLKVTKNSNNTFSYIWSWGNQFSNFVSTSGNTLIVKNKKLPSVVLHKFGEDLEKNYTALTNISFVVTGPNGYNRTFTTNANGNITITGLNAGKYKVVESKTISGWSKFSTPLYIIVKKINNEWNISFEYEYGEKLKASQVEYWEDEDAYIYNNKLYVKNSPTIKLKLSKNLLQYEDGALEGEAYAVFDSNTGILEFFRDEKHKYETGDVEDTKTYYSNIEAISTNPELLWLQNYKSNITGVIFNNIIRPKKSISKWFKGCNNLTQIVGIDRLDTQNVSDMSSLFEDCSNLEKIDISYFNTKNLSITEKMFANCVSLLEIKASKNFITENIENSNNMFIGCQLLNTNTTATTYDETRIDKELAKVASNEEEGYFILGNGQGKATLPDIDMSKINGKATYQVVNAKTHQEVTTILLNYDGSFVELPVELSSGEYYIREIIAPEGVEIDNTPYYFRINKNMTIDFYNEGRNQEPIEVTSDKKSYDIGNNSKIKKDTKYILIDLYDYITPPLNLEKVIIEKIDADTSEELTSAVFELYYIDPSTGEEVTIDTKRSGEEYLVDMSYSDKIYLKEKIVPWGYQCPMESAKIDANLNDPKSILPKDSELDDYNRIINIGYKAYFDKYGVKHILVENIKNNHILLTKYDDTGEQLVSGIIFKLEGITSNANCYNNAEGTNSAYSKIGVTDESGVCRFESVPPGEYIITEENAADYGYIGKTWKLIIDEFGNKTMEEITNEE